MRYWIEFYLYKSLRWAPRWLQPLATGRTRADSKLQTAGYLFDVGEVPVRGDPARSNFAVFDQQPAPALSEGRLLKKARGRWGGAAPPRPGAAGGP